MPARFAWLAANVLGCVCAASGFSGTAPRPLSSSAVVNASGSDAAAFEALFKRIVDTGLKDKRNRLAHGEATPREEAQAIRSLLIGSRSEPGVLCWLAEHLDGA